MDRDEIRAKLRPYIDGELPKEEVVAIQQFLDETPGAREELSRMLAEDDLLAAKVTAAKQEGESLRGFGGNISRDIRLSAMNAATGSRSGGGRRRRSWLWVGIVALALVVLFLYQWKGGDAPGDWLVTAPIDDMRTVLNAGRGGDAAIVQGWFAGRVGFTPPLPPAGGDAAHLVGGRLAYFLERPVAAYLYEADGRPLTLYVMSRDGLPESGADGVVFAPLEERMPEGLDGYRQVIWTAGPLFYSLTADLPQDWLVEIAEGFAADRD